MKQMPVSVEMTELEKEDGEGTIPGIVVTCSGCDHSVEVFGQGSASVRRACVMLREECPEGKQNWYYESEE